MAATLLQARLIAVVENRFVYDGRSAHELCFLMAGRLGEKELYERSDLGHVLDSGQPVSWQPVVHFRTGEAVLFPEDLLGQL